MFKYFVAAIASVLAAFWIAPSASAQWQELRAQVSGKCLDVNVRNVVQHECHGGDNQKWKIVGRQVVSKVNGMCLDATSNDWGSNVTVYHCHGERHQLWRYKPDGTIVNDKSGLCIDVTGGSVDNQTNIHMWGCNANPAQVWHNSYGRVKWLKIQAIEAVSPSAGIGDAARIMGQIGGYLAGASIEATPYFGETLGASTVTLIEEGTGGDMGDLGQAIVEFVDSKTAGADDTYIKVNGRKIAPTDRTSWTMDKGDYEFASFETPLLEDVRFEIIEYDRISDDNLGGMVFTPDMATTRVTDDHVYDIAVIASQDEGSIYNVYYQIYYR